MQKKKLLDVVGDKIRFKFYSMSTEKIYLFWIKNYISFYDKKNPDDLEKKDIEHFLTYLATKRKVAPVTQNQAFNALLFLYIEVLGIDMSEWNIQALRAHERHHIPIVLTKEEVRLILDNLDGIYKLIVSLMYGCGLRMGEALNLRIKDIDFGFDKVYVWDSKSLKGRTVPLPIKLKQQLLAQVETVTQLHKKDTNDGYGTVFLPFALEKKYPKAKFETKWQYLFPMRNLSKVANSGCKANFPQKDSRSGETRKRHVLPKTLSRNITTATKKSKINKKVTAHTFRHSYATHLLQSGVDIRTIQELLGHKSVKTATVYTHVAKEMNRQDVKSPLDF